MMLLEELFLLYSPWILTLLGILVSSKLLRWARNKKSSAFIFGALIQMVMPDPYAERTIKVVKESQKRNFKQQQEDEDKNDKLPKI